jgi:hypothetical protein
MKEPTMDGSGPKLAGYLMKLTETGFHNGNQEMKTTKTVRAPKLPERVPSELSRKRLWFSEM